MLSNRLESEQFLKYVTKDERKTEYLDILKFRLLSNEVLLSEERRI